MLRQRGEGEVKPKECLWSEGHASARSGAKGPTSVLAHVMCTIEP